MNIIRAVLVCLFMLIIAPYFIGNLLCRVSKGFFASDIIYRMVVGFLCEVGIWGILAYVYEFLFIKQPFHILSRLYLAITLVMTIAGFILCIRDNNKKRLHPFTCKHNMIRIICLAAFIVIFGRQLGRIVLVPEFEYSDEIDYIPRINDVVHMDRLFSKNEVTGERPKAVNMKRLFGPWYAMIAVMCDTSCVHPAFMCRVIIPAYVLALFYSTTYLYGRRYANVDTHVFLLCVSCVAEALWNSNLIFYNIVYPVMWGKIILNAILIPTIFMVIDNDINPLICFLLGACGCTLSLMSPVFILIELVTLIGVYYISDKENLITKTKSCLACGLPLLMQLALFLVVQLELVTINI